MSSSSERDQVRLKLAERYYDALQAADLESIYREDHHSGIFLAAPHEAYFSGSSTLGVDSSLGVEPR